MENIMIYVIMFVAGIFVGKFIEYFRSQEGKINKLTLQRDCLANIINLIQESKNKNKNVQKIFLIDV